MRTRIANQLQAVARNEGYRWKQKIATGRAELQAIIDGTRADIVSPLRAGLAQSHGVSARRSHPITEAGTDAAIGASPIQVCFGKGSMAVVGKGFAEFQSRNVHASGVAACLTWAAVHR
jgi:hypothetical protein